MTSMTANNVGPGEMPHEALIAYFHVGGGGGEGAKMGLAVDYNHPTFKPLPYIKHKLLF